MDNIKFENHKNEPVLLSFDEFVKEEDVGVKYNNFIAFFMKPEGILIQIYTNAPHAKKLKEEHPELYKSLSEQIQKVRSKGITQRGDYKDLQPELYKAYKIMRGYGVSDHDLFT